MSRNLLVDLISAILLVFAPAAQAQTMSDADMAGVQLALNRGQLLYAYDQAAWHGTDAMVEDARSQGKMDELSFKAGGWVIRTAEESSLEFVIFDKSLDSPKLLYVARLTEGGTKVIAHSFPIGEKSEPDAVTLRLIKAHRIALEAIDGKEILRCSQKAFNIAVLPPEADGAIPVYLLTPQTQMEEVPFGGHTRLTVAADGTVGAAHPFTKTCLSLPSASTKNAPKALVVTQLLDPLPTEIDVFTMFAARLPLCIGTPDGRIWSVESSGGQARIRLLPADAKKK